MPDCFQQTAFRSLSRNTARPLTLLRPVNAGMEIARYVTSCPESVVFYASGRASLEASYMYQLFARMYGCNSSPPAHGQRTGVRSNVSAA
jgi:hypothetical protein